MKRRFVEQLHERFKGKSPLIQVVLGPRQVGKTTGVMQFLEAHPHPHHYANADAVLSGTHEWVIEQWQTAKRKGAGTVLAIDEIQKIPQWAEMIKQLWDQQAHQKEKIKLLLLGSSSLSLQQGLTESLAGRLEIIPVYHWDYQESQQLAGLSLQDYLQYGGYPKSYEWIQDEDRWYAYVMHSIIDRVIDKDILHYAQVKHPALFRQAFEIVCCYPAQEISYRKLLGQLQDKGNTDLIKHYLALFEGAFLIKTLQKYHNQAFKIKSSSPKVLLMAPCFYWLFAAKAEKQPFIFENTVGAKLLTIANKLFYWREGNHEVDFVMQWQKRLFAIEVKSGKKRQAGGLSVFMGRFPEAVPIIISPDNYEDFIADPVAFLNAC